MKKTILLTNHYEGLPKQILEEAIHGDFNLKVLDEVNDEELEKNIEDADYLLVSGRQYVGEKAISKAKKLKMIQRTGVGMDNMDLECFKKYNIPLYVNRGVNSVSVAEHTLLLMLATLKKSYKVNSQIRNGVWKKQQTGLTTHQLSGKTVGLVGMGNIGKNVVKMLSGFNVHIYYYDKFRLSQDLEKELHVTYCEFNDLLPLCDIISLHCPYDKNQGYLFTDQEFDLMKQDSIIINTARGKLIEESALVKALESGKLSACGIDAYEQEPVSKDSKLFGFDQAILSPHIAGVSYEAFQSMLELGIENIRQYDLGNLKDIEKNRVV